MDKYRFLHGLKVVLFVALMITLYGYALMYLWNWLIPDLFNGNAITFFQALGLLVLAKLLVGFRPWGGGWGGMNPGKRSWMKKRWEEKWSNMTPEQREQLKQRCKTHFSRKTPAEATEAAGEEQV